MRLLPLQFVVLGAALLSGSCATAPNTPEAYPEIARLYLHQFDNDGPGAVMLAARGGVVRFSASRGLADVENPVALTPRTILRIASLTKQFTAVGILALVDDGLIELEDRLATRLPDCPPAWRHITIAQLLSHTSGLTDDLNPLRAHIRDDLNPRELVGLFADQPLESLPGERWRYSNLDYWILGIVIEEVTGRSYTEYVDQRVLQPAELAFTRYGDTATIIKGRAAGYVRTPRGGLLNAPYFSSTIGYSAGGYVSTPAELAKWYTALSGGKIISDTMVRKALDPVLLRDGSSAGFGLGWYLDEIDGKPVAHHGGSSIGYSAYLYWGVENAVFAAVFTNDGSLPEPSCAARTLYRAALGDTAGRGSPASSLIPPGFRSRPTGPCIASE